MYSPERRGLQFSDFEVPTSDDDSSVLLSNTNKLLFAVGISAKKIVSTEELSRVASSMIVAIFESLFHQRIDGIIRNPTSIHHYERNAQLVIDSLSDQIQLDLQHITGKSIVKGDLRVLSNLVHILVRIVSLTSQESLTSYGSSERKEFHQLPFHHQYGRDNASISTRDSEDYEKQHDGLMQQTTPYYVTSTKVAAAATGNGLKENHNSGHSNVSNDMGTPGGILFNEDLRRSLAQMEKLMQIETKLEAARVRRSNNMHMKEANLRAANQRHGEVSRGALQRKWVEEEERARQAFLMKQTNDDQVALRKVYRGLLQRIARWRLEEQREEKEKKALVSRQAAQTLQSLQTLFEERARVLADHSRQLREAQHAAALSGVKSEREMAEALARSVASRNLHLLSRERARLQQERQRELQRRKEAHGHLLALLPIADWKDMLRDAAFTA